MLVFWHHPEVILWWRSFVACQIPFPHKLKKVFQDSVCFLSCWHKPRDSSADCLEGIRSQKIWGDTRFLQEMRKKTKQQQKNQRHKQTEITFEKLFFLLKNSLSMVFLYDRQCTIGKSLNRWISHSMCQTYKEGHQLPKEWH